MRYHRSMRFPVISALSCVLATLVTACSGGGGATPDSIARALPTPAVHFSGNPPLVPSPDIYLGAFANTGAGSSDELMLATLESEIGRTFALSMHYRGWTSNFPAQAEVADAQAGRIPVISWDCGVPNAQVASGSQDANIAARADALRAYAGPVFLRYQWEMNLPVSANPRAGCYDPNTDGTNGFFSPTEFVAAWNHIHAIFVAHGATNVAFLWNPGGGGDDPGPYYPGSATVDWVGIDQYDRNDEPFADVFDIYPKVAGYDKPILIAETGASPTYQPIFFAGAVTALKTLFPAVKGFMYFDAAGKVDWRLSSPGIAAFAAVARDPYLSAR